MAEESTLLEAIIVAIIGLGGATIAVFWRSIEAWNKERIFQKLILRELEEFYPHPTVEEIKNDPRKERANWTKHFPDRRFLHETIFQNPDQHLDLMLGLNPNLVYYVSQLWDEIKLQEHLDPPVKIQFLHYWDRIDNYCKRSLYLRRGEIKDTYKEWTNLIRYYENKNVSTNAPNSNEIVDHR
jgi:hypothetical protein